MMREYQTMALELRPNCEFCDKDLPPASTEARICTYECTFCADCVEHELHDVCPNCGGGFEPRPIRPATAVAPGPLAGRAPGVDSSACTCPTRARTSPRSRLG